MMVAQHLAEALTAAGLTVRGDPGWDNRGASWTYGRPIGVMHHHTAPPVPYPIDRLNGRGDARIKCNINTKPDGTVWLVAYDACNYSSGLGLRDVFYRVLTGRPPKANARDAGYTASDDSMNGNPLFFNFENDHPGDGSPIPDVQLEAIVTATQVVLDHYDLTAGNVISHAEWTARKSDPYWNGSRRAIDQIRNALEEATVPLTDEDIRRIWAFPTLTPGVTTQLALTRAERGVNALLLGEAVSDDDLDAAADRIIALVPDRVLDRLYQRLAPGPS